MHCQKIRMKNHIYNTDYETLSITFRVTSWLQNAQEETEWLNGKFGKCFFVHTISAITVNSR